MDPLIPVVIILIPTYILLLIVLMHRTKLCQWNDEREKMLVPLVLAAKAATTGAQPHSDAEWGYAHGVPSRNSLQLIEVARSIERDRARWSQDIQKHFAALEIWEANHPVPSYWDLLPVDLQPPDRRMIKKAIKHQQQALEEAQKERRR